MFEENGIKFKILKGRRKVGTGDYSSSGPNAVKSSFAGKLEIPERVKSPEGFFYFVKEIGPFSFYACEKITSVFVPSCVEIINEQGLANLKYCINISFGENSQLKEIKYRGMVNLYKLKTLVFTGNCLKLIAERALAYAYVLNELVIPSSVIKIGPVALCGLREIKKIYYCGRSKFNNDIMTYSEGTQTNSAAEIYVTTNYLYKIFGDRSNLKTIVDETCLRSYFSCINDISYQSQRKIGSCYLLIILAILSY